MKAIYTPNRSRITQTFLEKAIWGLLFLNRQRHLRQKFWQCYKSRQLKNQLFEKVKTQTRNLLLLVVKKCLLSSCDEGSEGLEKFLSDKLDSLSGEGLERIVEVDPTVVLELLDEGLVDHGSAGSNVVPVDIEMPRSRVDYILRSGLKEKRIGSVSKRPL